MGLTRKFKLDQADVMAIVKANDGEGSGVDADLLDGKHAADILPEHFVRVSIFKTEEGRRIEIERV